jgi:hypothetical protein
MEPSPYFLLAKAIKSEPNQPKPGPVDGWSHLKENANEGVLTLKHKNDPCSSTTHAGRKEPSAHARLAAFSCCLAWPQV